jgi:hypothetical protein
MWINRAVAIPLIAAFMVLGQACDRMSPVSPDASPSSGLQVRTDTVPFPAPAAFVPTITNPFLPLNPGRYRAETDEGVEVTRVTVTSETKMILGVRATVVHDEVFLNGTLTEDTFDWFAQDNEGNVWYLGEHSCEIVNGQCASTQGPWEAGVSGAEAGIVM